MANIQKELTSQPVEDLKIWVDIIVNRAGDSDSYLKPTTTAMMVTTKFPKESHPALKRRKLGSAHWDKIHEAIQGQKRDASECPSDYQLCPKSLDGGCCPNDRSCGKSSCYLTTTATASACGIAGYTACGIAEGGGCCPNGYFCATDGCKASPGVSFSQTCGVNSYLCPASLNYGCCQNGMGCGLNNCYSTAVTTFTLTETLTTTSDSQTQTITSTLVTASTPASPSVAANTSKASAIPKITPTPTVIAKTKASVVSSSSSTSSGLTKAQIGGIIGGAGFILLVVIIAAFWILRRIQKVAAIEEKKVRSRSASTPSQPQGPAGTSPLSIDSYQIIGSERSPSIRNNSHPYSIEAEGMEAVSPQMFATPFSPYSPYGGVSPGQQGQVRTTNPTRGYHAVPGSDSAYSQASSGRNPSVERTPPHQTAQDCFNIPPHHRRQNLRHAHDGPVSPIRRPSQHGRNWSDASDVSGTSSSPLVDAVELDAGDDGDLKFGLSKAWKVLGLGSWKGKMNKISRNTLLTVSSSGEGTNTLERDIGGRLAGVEEETGSFIGEGEGEAEGHLRESRPRSKESGSRPRSGLSNAELREASMKNFQGAKGNARPRAVYIARNSGGSGIGIAPGAGGGQVMGPLDGGSKAEEAGYGGY